MAAQPTTPTTSTPDLHVPEHPVRIVTASALFDGHDASINIMRRIMQAQGAEVVHLGHNRSVREVVDAAIEEDVQGVAVSSYQGGHVEYFEYLVQLLRESGAGHVKVVGGGGGVIVPAEIERLRAAGVTIFSPAGRPAARAAGHGQPGRAGVRHRPVGRAPDHGGGGAVRRAGGRGPRDHRGRDRAARRRPARRAGARGEHPPHPRAGHHRHRWLRQVQSLTDELVRRLRVDQQDKLRVAVRRDRPDPAPGWRRPARRPDPDELARRRPHLLPLARHPRRPRGARGARRRAHHPQGGRLRPRRRRDPRHRPGRRRDHPASPTSRST